MHLSRVSKLKQNSIAAKQPAATSSEWMFLLSLHQRNDEKFHVFDHFSIEKTICSGWKQFSLSHCSLVHRFQWSNSRLIEFYFSRILIGRKLKLIQKLFSLRKCTSHLFLRSSKAQWSRKNAPESGRNECLLFSAWDKSPKRSMFSIISPSKGRSAEEEYNFLQVTVPSSVVSNDQIAD